MKLSPKIRAALDAERTIAIEVYQDHGFDSRADYIEALVEEFDEELVVAAMAVLPPSEDFDGLVSELEDWHVVNGQLVRLKKQESEMRPTALLVAALLTAGFTAWYLARVKDELFDDIDIKFRRGDLGGWGDD